MALKPGAGSFAASIVLAWPAQPSRIDDREERYYPSDKLDHPDLFCRRGNKHIENQTAIVNHCKNLLYCAWVI